MRLPYLFCLLLWLAPQLAHADDAPRWRLSGYGTLAATYSSNNQADFRTNFFQPEGSGYTRDVDFGTDSKLAVQLDARLNSQWGATLQALSQRNYDNSFTPELEWANLQYRPSANLMLHAGRIVAPSFLLAETRNVGYAQTTAHPPNELYFALPYYHLDGFDASYAHALGDGTLTWQLAHGLYRQKLIGPRNYPVQIHQKLLFLNAVLDYHEVLYRLGYTRSYSLDTDSPGIDRYNQAMATLLSQQVPGAATVNDNLRFHGLRGKNLTLGISHESDALLLQAEMAWLTTETNTALDARTGYLLLGKKFGRWTPFAAYARWQCRERFNLPTINASGYAPEVQQAAAIVNGTSYSQQIKREQTSLTAGVRLEITPSIDMKLQLEHIHKPAGGIGVFTNAQPSFINQRQHSNVFTLAADFVF